MTIKPRRIKKGYSYILTGKIKRGDYVALKSGDWEEAFGLVGHCAAQANDDGWRVCRKIA